MGRKSSTETISAVLLTLLEERTIKQAELSRRADVSRKALVKVLDDLRLAGLPVERSEDPPHVYWSVPKTWFPGAVAFAGEQIQALLRLLRHAPESPTRAMLLAKVVHSAAGVRGNVDSDIVTGALSEEEEQYLWEIEDALERRQAVRLRYYSEHRGSMSWRFASVQRVVIDGSVRFVVQCHNDDVLKWFRLDNVQWARAFDSEPYRDVAREDVDRFVNESAAGYHSGQEPVPCVFRVRLPEARWVRKQLGVPAEVEELPDGMRFTTRTAGLLPLARYVVGLGDAAFVETEELRELVRELARGAMGEKTQ